MCRSMIAFLLLTAAGTLLAAQPGAGQPFSVVEATIPEMQAAMAQHCLTSRELVLQYLVRIALYADKLHAAITVNPVVYPAPADNVSRPLPNCLRGINQPVISPLIRF